MSNGFDLNWGVSQGFSHKAFSFLIYVSNLFDVIRFRLFSVLVYFGVTQRYPSYSVRIILRNQTSTLAGWRLDAVSSVSFYRYNKP